MLSRRLISNVQRLPLSEWYNQAAAIVLRIARGITWLTKKLFALLTKQLGLIYGYAATIYNAHFIPRWNDRGDADRGSDPRVNGAVGVLAAPTRIHREREKMTEAGPQIPVEDALMALERQAAGRRDYQAANVLKSASDYISFMRKRIEELEAPDAREDVQAAND